MSQEYASPKLPKNLIFHPSDFITYLQQQIGICNFDTGFDHFFLNAELFHIITERTDMALKMKIIGRGDYRLGVKEKKYLTPEVMQKINRVWHGRTWLHMQRNSNLDIIWWKIKYSLNDIKLKYRQEVIPMPPLKLMSPITEIKDPKELGVRIRTQVPFRYAWWGYDWQRLVTSGKFFYDWAEGKKPMIESDEDIMNSEELIDYVSREYFNNTIGILVREWRKWESILFLEMHKIIEDARFGYGEEQSTSNIVELINEAE